MLWSCLYQNHACCGILSNYCGSESWSLASQGNKPMDYRTNQARVFTQGTNHQGQIILPWTHHAKPQLSIKDQREEEDNQQEGGWIQLQWQ